MPKFGVRIKNPPVSTTYSKISAPPRLCAIYSLSHEILGLGYGFEAIARGQKQAGEIFTDALAQARTQAEAIEDADSKALLVKDLDSL